jgi:predicted neuraminidase
VSRLARLLLLVAALGAGAAARAERRLIFPEQLGIKHHCATLTQLGGGSLLAAWYYGYTHHGESDVGGAILGALHAEGEWSAPFVLFDSYRDAEGNPVIHWDPGHRRLHLFTGTMREDFKWDSLTTHWLTAEVATAADIRLGEFQPVTWGTPRTLVSGGWQEVDPEQGSRGYVLRNKPLVLPRRLLLPIYIHDANRYVGSWSMDLATEEWSAISLIPADDAEQPALARLASGDLLMVTRNTAAGMAWTSRSSDEGRTWDPVAPHPSLVNENNSLDLVTLPDGALVAVYNTDRSRSRLELGVSRDDGATWDRRVLEDQPNAEFSYPTALLDRDGETLHVVYSFLRRSIAHARIPVAELAAP